MECFQAAGLPATCESRADGMLRLWVGPSSGPPRMGCLVCAHPGRMQNTAHSTILLSEPGVPGIADEAACAARRLSGHLRRPVMLSYAFSPDEASPSDVLRDVSLYLRSL